MGKNIQQSIKVNLKGHKGATYFDACIQYIRRFFFDCILRCIRNCSHVPERAHISVLIPNLPYAEHDSLPTVVTELPPDKGRTALDVTSHLIIQRFQYLRKGSEYVIDLNCRDPTLPRDILRLSFFDTLSIHFCDG